MNKVVLLAGAATMMILGLITEDRAEGAGGLVLMWIGLSINKKGGN